MNLEKKIAEMDSLERLELEMEIDKKLDKKRDEEFKRTIAAIAGKETLDVDKLIAALDKRYIRRQI